MKLVPLVCPTCGAEYRGNPFVITLSNNLSMTDLHDIREMIEKTPMPNIVVGDDIKITPLSHIKCQHCGVVSKIIEG